jgi:hypothetical protein
MVWVHVVLATISWLTVLWAVAAAGQLVPRSASVSDLERQPAPRELEPVGRTG